MIHKVKGFSIVNEAEVDSFMELTCFLHDPMNVDNLNSVSSLKPSWYIWKLLIHKLLKASLKDSEFLGIYPNELKTYIYTKTGTSMNTVALFKIAKSLFKLIFFNTKNILYWGIGIAN